MAIINGNDSAEFLETTGSADVVNALGGSDTIEGGGGADRMDGGFGLDTVDYVSSTLGVTVALGDGASDGSGSGGDAEGDTFISIENLSGSNFNDTLVGNDGANRLFGAGGRDVLKGLGGDDTLSGSGTLDGGTGDDLLVGASLADTLRGGDDDDDLLGLLGADLIDGGAGIDTAIYSGSRDGIFVTFDDSKPESGGDADGDQLIGIENIVGSNENDFIAGNGGANAFEGNFGRDTLFGGGGADRLEGEEGDDFLAGEAGDDLLVGGTGADVHDGGAGRDRVHYLESNAGVFVDMLTNEGAFGAAEGDTWVSIESMSGSNFTDTLRGDNFANDLFGALGNDTLAGRAGDDELLGSLGDDLLFGDAGEDTLDGGENDDAMVGGAGDDTYVVDSLLDIVDEAVAGSSGIDTVQSSISLSLASLRILGPVENLTLLGGSDLNATGNELANVLVGNAGDNRLVGGDGADTLRGGSGDDVYFVDNAGDVVSEGGANGVDQIRSTVSIALGGGQVQGTVENVQLIGTANVSAFGNAVANQLFGNSGVNVLNGGAGNDLLRGGSGGDFFVFSTPLSGSTNVDVVDDFAVSQDTIRIENAVFTGLSNGLLSAAAFRIGVAAADASDRIIYNDDTGALLFDADGAGGAAAVRFATLDTDLAMTSDDFFII